MNSQVLRNILTALCLTLFFVANVASAQLLVNGKTDNTRLLWAGQNVSNCFATGGYGNLWTTVVPTSGSVVSGTGSKDWLKNTFTVPGYYVFSITCRDIYGVNITDDTDMQVTYPPATIDVKFSNAGVNPYYGLPTLAFFVGTTYVPKLMGTALSWQFSDPLGGCVASGSGWSGNKGTSGITGTEINYSTNTIQRTYTLTCTDHVGNSVSGQYVITFVKNA